MKILVFDDSIEHRQAAELTLKGHELTIVGTYDEAQEALVPQTNYKLRDELLAQMIVAAGLPADFNRYSGESSDEDNAKYDKAGETAYEQATAYPNFDVVLTDLLVPASKQAQGPEGDRFVGQEMPLGTTIALLALTAGIKNVAVVTDKNHHCHPASAAFDCFPEKTSPCVPGINLLCTNGVSCIPIDKATGQLVEDSFLKSDAGKSKYPYLNPDGWGPRKGLARGKDWDKVLKKLLGEKE